MAARFPWLRRPIGPSPHKFSDIPTVSAISLLRMKTTTAWANDDRWRYRDLAATHGQGPDAGALAAASWLAARGLLVPARTRWAVSIVLDVADEVAPESQADAVETRLHIAIASGEWGFYFCYLDRASWIRITDVPSIHQRDDFALLFKVPPLRELGKLVRWLEETYGIRFRRDRAVIRSTIEGAEPAIREWVRAAL